MKCSKTIDTICDVVSRVKSPDVKVLPRPQYTGMGKQGLTGPKLGLAVESMREHMTDEGWQIFQGLEYAGYKLYGHGLPNATTDVQKIVDSEKPSMVVIQDVREWDTREKDFRDREAKFIHYYRLGVDTDIYKATILKDSHQRPEYHRRFMDEIQANAFITYYHPRLVKHFAPYVREEDIIRTWHTIDSTKIPKFLDKKSRCGALLSGAISPAYPLRERLFHAGKNLPLTVVLPHPGYRRDGCVTPKYLETLNRYRIAICTCSIYGYALRKIIEATACGCRVITNLPSDEVLPEIDANLVRIPTTASNRVIGDIIREEYTKYDEERQRHYSTLASLTYDYRVMGVNLALSLQSHRVNYNSTIPSDVGTLKGVSTTAPATAPTPV